MSDPKDKVISNIARQIADLTSRANISFKKKEFEEGARLMKEAYELGAKNPEMLNYVDKSKLLGQMAKEGFTAAEREVTKEIIAQGEKMVAEEAGGFVIRGVLLTGAELATLVGVVVVIAVLAAAIGCAIGALLGNRKRSAMLNAQTRLRDGTGPAPVFKYWIKKAH